MWKLLWTGGKHRDKPKLIWRCLFQQLLQIGLRKNFDKELKPI